MFKFKAFVLTMLAVLAPVWARAIAAPTGLTVTAQSIDHTAVLLWNEDSTAIQWYIYLDGVLSYQPLRANTTLNTGRRQFVLNSLPRFTNITLTMKAIATGPVVSAVSAAVALTCCPTTDVVIIGPVDQGDGNPSATPWESHDRLAIALLQTIAAPDTATPSSTISPTYTLTQTPSPTATPSQTPTSTLTFSLTLTLTPTPTPVTSPGHTLVDQGAGGSSAWSVHETNQPTPNTAATVVAGTNIILPTPICTSTTFTTLAQGVIVPVLNNGVFTIQKISASGSINVQIYKGLDQVTWHLANASNRDGGGLLSSLSNATSVGVQINTAVEAGSYVLISCSASTAGNLVANYCVGLGTNYVGTNFLAIQGTPVAAGTPGVLPVSMNGPATTAKPTAVGETTPVPDSHTLWGGLRTVQYDDAGNPIATPQAIPTPNTAATILATPVKIDHAAVLGVVMPTPSNSAFNGSEPVYQPMPQTGNTTLNGAGQSIVIQTDGWPISAQRISGSGTGTVTFFGSNDGATWTAYSGFARTGSAFLSQASEAFATVVDVTFAPSYKYVSLSCTAFTSGSVAYNVQRILANYQQPVNWNAINGVAIITGAGATGSAVPRFAGTNDYSAAVLSGGPATTAKPTVVLETTPVPDSHTLWGGLRIAPYDDAGNPWPTPALTSTFTFTPTSTITPTPTSTPAITVVALTPGGTPLVWQKVYQLPGSNGDRGVGSITFQGNSLTISVAVLPTQVTTFTVTTAKEITQAAPYHFNWRAADGPWVWVKATLNTDILSLTLQYPVEVGWWVRRLPQLPDVESVTLALYRANPLNQGVL